MPVIVPGWITFPSGGSGNSLTVPDSADWDIGTNGITLIAEIRVPVWVDPTVRVLVSQRTSAGIPWWDIRLSTAGSLQVLTSDGTTTTTTTAASTAALAAVPVNEWVFLAVVYRPSVTGNRRAFVYWSTDKVNWILVDSSTSNPAVVPTASTQAFQIASHGLGFNAFVGSIRNLSLHQSPPSDLPGGTKVFEITGNELTLPTLTSFVASTGETVTITRNASPALALTITPVTITNPPDYQTVDTTDIEPPTFTLSEVYKVMVYETMTGDYVGDLPATYLNYTHVLNGPGACEVHFPIRDNKGTIVPDGIAQKLTSPQVEEYTHTIVITKNDVLVWAGFWARTRGGSIDNRVYVAGVGFWDYFRYRLVRPGENHPNADIFAIVRDLVNSAQSIYYLDIGVDTGSEVAGVNTALVVNDYDFRTYGDVVEDLARQESARFDFRIDSALDPNGNLLKLFKLGYPKLGTRRSFVATLGSNIMVYSWERDGSQRFTRLFGVGAGEGVGTLVVQGGDTTTYGRVPVRDGTVTRKEIPRTRQAQLQGIVNSEARKYTQPIEVLSLTLYGKNIVGGFTEGDSIQAVIDDGFVQLDQWLRILSYTVRVQDNGEETVDVELGPEWATGG